MNDEWDIKKEQEKEPDEWSMKKDFEKGPDPMEMHKEPIKQQDEWEIKKEAEKVDEWTVKQEAEKVPDPFAEKREQKDDWSVSPSTFDSFAPTYGSDMPKPAKKGIPTWVWIVGAVVVVACLCCVVIFAIPFLNGTYTDVLNQYGY